MVAHSPHVNNPASCSATAIAKACASHGSRKTGASPSRGMLPTASVARRAVSGATAAISGRLTAHVPARTQIVLGLLCAGGGALLLSRLGTDRGLAPALLLIGTGAGIALPATTATAVSAVAATRTGMASAIHNASRQVGATLGVAALGSIVTTHAATGRAADYADGLSLALLVAAAALLACAVLTVRLVR